MTIVVYHLGRQYRIRVYNGIIVTSVDSTEDTWLHDYPEVLIGSVEQIDLDVGSAFDISRVVTALIIEGK